MTVIRINEPRSVVAGGVSVTVEGDVIEHDLDPVKLGAGPAAAIRTAIELGIKAITAAAAPATLKYRAEARKAVARGTAWAVERFGARPPGSSTRLFNDSGELANGIRVDVAGDSYNVTAPADRLEDLPGAAPGSTLARLRALVPALSDPLAVAAVRQAMEAAWAMAVRLVR